MRYVILLPFGLLLFLQLETRSQGAMPAPPEGRWLLVADFTGGKYHLPVEIVREGKGGISATALGSGVKFSGAEFKNGRLTLKGTASTLGAIEIRGLVNGTRMQGDWRAGSQRGRIVGERQEANSSPQLRLKVFDEVWQTIDKEYFDPTFNGVDWQAVQARYRPEAQNLQNDSELLRIVRGMLNELRTSHLWFSLLDAEEAYVADPVGAAENGPITASKSITWRHLSPVTGYIKISSFTEGAEFLQLIDRAFEELGNVPALVIDLRDNGGGSLNGAMRLGDHLFDQPRPVGSFATRAALEHRKLTSIDQMDAAELPVYSGYDMDGFRSMLREKGALTLVTGGRAKPPYRGKLIVMINRVTASAAEAVAAVFQELRLAVVVGPRPTAGKMLSSRQVKLTGGWTLTLPEADFRTPNGVRLEGIGVKPDIVVKPASSSEDVPLNEASKLAERLLR